jgi:NADH-quinone oxidoreductase subunit L
VSPDKITLITLLLFVGATGKSAQFHSLSGCRDAMADFDTGERAHHAATMVTAGAYYDRAAPFPLRLGTRDLSLIADRRSNGLFRRRGAHAERHQSASGLFTVSQLGLCFSPSDRCIQRGDLSSFYPCFF